MKTIQYTIRSIPEPVDHYLRKRARQSGKSLNQIIVEELSEKVASPTATTKTAFAWFVGSGMDDATLRALDEDDKVQKELASKDL
jgi:pyrroline-5-carboxylate reductase